MDFVVADSFAAVQLCRNAESTSAQRTAAVDTILCALPNDTELVQLLNDTITHIDNALSGDLQPFVLDLPPLSTAASKEQTVAAVDIALTAKGVSAALARLRLFAAHTPPQIAQLVLICARALALCASPNSRFFAASVMLLILLRWS